MSNPVRTPAKPSSGLVPPLEICFRLSHAHAVVTRRLDNGLSSLHGLSFSDFTILYLLARAPAKKLRRIDLAEQLALTASGVTRSLLPLEKLGLVSRESDPRDARVAHAVLTNAGQRLLGHALVSAEQISRELMGAAAAEDIEKSAEVLRRLSDGRASAR